MLPCYYFTEFEDWKNKYEKNTNSWFVLGSGEKELVDGVSIHYYYSGVLKISLAGANNSVPTTGLTPCIIIIHVYTCNYSGAGKNIDAR